MTTNSKKKKHALNPIIILSFIVIGLLFVILTIAMKENIDVNDSLKASVSQCSDLTKDTDKTIRGEGTGAGARLAKQAAYADAVQKFNTWWTTNTSLGGTDGTGKEQTEKALANELDCAKGQPQCQQKRNTTVTCLPTQRANCSYTTSTKTTPISAIASCVFGIRCSNACENIIKETASTSPVVYPICSKSGTRSQDCNPNSKGVFRAENSVQATSPEGSNVQERAGLASAEAVRLAKDGLEARCSALATNDPMKACAAQTKGCEPGCKPNGKSIYKAPYTLIDKSGYPVIDPKITDCKLTLVSTTSTTVTMQAECYASCRYEQDCIPIETPSPTPPRRRLR